MEMEKLENLSSDEISRLILSIQKSQLDRRVQELQKVGLESLELYKPYDIQESFHSSNERIRLFVGGNFSGKTLAGGRESDFWLLKKHPYLKFVNEANYPHHGIGIVHDHKQQKLPGGAQDKLMSALPRELIRKIYWNRWAAIDSIHMIDGSTFSFKSSEAGRIALSSARMNFIWFDEDCIPNASYWNEMVTRLPSFGKRLYIWGTMTPNLDERSSFLVNQVLPTANKNRGIRMWEAGINDNPYATDVMKSDLRESLFGDQREINARLMGNWRHKKGLVYNFNLREHVIPEYSIEEMKTNFKLVYRIIDPHHAKPIAVVFAAITYDNDIVIFDELYQQGLIGQVAGWIKKKTEGLEHLLQCTIIDYSAKATRKLDGRSVVDDFRAEGIVTRNCVKDLSAINRVKRFLFFDKEKGIEPKMRVCANCTHTIREFGSYMWDSKTGKPRKEFDDLMDGIRYLVSDPTFSIHLKDGVDIGGSKQIDMSKQTNIISAKDHRVARRIEMLGDGIGR